jgi:hypothetical protein
MTKLNELAAKGKLYAPANGQACKFVTVSMGTGPERKSKRERAVDRRGI